MATQKTMNAKQLEGTGEADYDRANDILSFKIKEREYHSSLEFENIIIDLDNESYITGIQIFDASKFLEITKSNLKINQWQLKAEITPAYIEIRLHCQIMIRNKIKELNPIIRQQNTQQLPTSIAIIS